MSENLIAVLWAKLPLSELTNETLSFKIDELIKSFKIEVVFHLIDELPRTNNCVNKIDRDECRSLLSKLMNLEEEKIAEKLPGVMIRFNE